ncbi:MAG: 50S ribosomal protein L29 [Anaerolineaceae bacterium]|nr:50S ribosomal protein L29 [Anaerolineaceae bacterium]
MNTKEMRELSVDELKLKMKDARQELMNLRFQMVTGQLTDISRFKVTRRLIARFETILAERGREAKES